MRNPTPHQLELLAAIYDFTAKFGTPPSLAEASVVLNTSRMDIADRVRCLRSKACLAAGINANRALVLTPWGRQQLRDSGRLDVDVVPTYRRRRQP